MSIEDHSPVDVTVEIPSMEGHQEQGNTLPITLQREIPAQSHMTRENTTNNNLITTQPRALALLAATSALGPSGGEIGATTRRHSDLHTDFHTGLAPSALGLPEAETRRGTDHRLSPLSLAMSRAQDSSLYVQRHSSKDSRSSRKESRDSTDNSHKPRAIQEGCCLPLVLACLSCQCSTLILGLLKACSSCLHTFCSSCCHCCSRCCAALQEAPVEDLHCHTHCDQILFESCCEPTECLEFCLECCELCHKS
ncbi:myoD family inhibitor domain-containing protein-like [Coregonus clupeaformis]|uniref:myoD family inhibitor domain-containing protein-like n=1 Tax=Coregonus clupeaformis TaxID=59861 RepID=UPI001E1C6FF8|nr:myoD family inhibitor domain-containing protein-like [Coregonus clupeaformis]